MTRLVRVQGPPLYARVYLHGHRTHHGLLGVAIAAAALTIARQHHATIPAVALTAGVALMWHDRRDFPWTTDR